MGCKHRERDRKSESGETEKADTMADNQRSRWAEGQEPTKASFSLWGLLQQSPGKCRDTVRTKIFPKPAKCYEESRRNPSVRVTHGVCFWGGCERDSWNGPT